MDVVPEESVLTKDNQERLTLTSSSEMGTNPSLGEDGECSEDSDVQQCQEKGAPGEYIGPSRKDVTLGGLKVECIPGRDSGQLSEELTFGGSTDKVQWHII